MSWQSEIQVLLEDLLRETGASRTTFRADLPGDNCTVALPIAEALAPGIPSMGADTSIKQREAETVVWLEKNRKILVQNDVVNAALRPPTQLIKVYGAKAQMLAPVEKDGAMIGWISVHYSPSSREWQPAEIATLERAVARVLELLDRRTNAA